MKENLLHFIWKLKLFTTKNLQSTNGELVEIISSGTENFNSGPDFLNAKVYINKQLWAGNVEIHINSSDWYSHGHETDNKYDSVILHVVWEHDVEIFRSTEQVIETLELKNYISKSLLNKYGQLFDKNKKWINCENEIKTIKAFTFSNWKERLYFERLEQKSNHIQSIFKETNNDWEKTLFVLLAQNFGLKVNSDSFLSMAKSVDFSIVRKISSNAQQLEALLMGQAGLLSEKKESTYHKLLKIEYDYFVNKFGLITILNNQMQFFRLRPNNFPTIRLSQLAGLYHNHKNLFSNVIEIQDLESFYELFNVSTSTFWETHYTFEKESKKSKKRLSKSFIDLLIINTIIPLKFMYLKSLGKHNFNELIPLVEDIKPEKNSIIKNFTSLKVDSKSAFDSQALLQLKNKYCNAQRCLECAVGNELLKPNL
jgi:hypothetical protein